MGLADSKHFLKLVHAVATNPDAGSQAWADASKTPKATAYRLLRVFRFHGAISENSANPRLVLQLAANLRKDRAVPFTTIFRPGDLARLESSETIAHLAYQSAANALGFFEEDVKTIRIDPSDRNSFLAGISGSGTIQVDSDGKFGGRGRRPLAIVYVEELSRFPPPLEMNQGLVTDPLITYMDLLSHPRAGAHAEFLDGVLVRSGLLPERT